MQYTVTRGEKGKVEVKVDVPKVDFAKIYDDTLDTLGKDIKIDGFRPGNVPRDVIEAQIGANKILNEAASFSVSKNLSEIFKKENIAPLGNPSVAIHSLGKDLAFSFTATVVSKPKVKIGDWKKIKVKRVSAREVAEKDVEESIKNIYDAWEKQKATSDKQQVTSDANKKSDDQQSGKFIYDARGEKIFLSDTKQETRDTKGEIDDNFAKAIGARDLAHLREIVAKDLEQIVADEVEAKVEQELFDELLKIVDVQVPDILVDDEINRIIVRIGQNLEGQGKKLEDYLKEENTTLDGLKAKLRPQAQKNVEITLAMDEIGKSEKVEVTPEEIKNASKGVDDAKLSETQKADLRNYLRVSMFQAKTLDLVKKAIAA